MKACRGIGASLPEEQIEQFDREHMALLEQSAPHEFSIFCIILHQRAEGKTGGVRGQEPVKRWNEKNLNTHSTFLA